MSIFEQYPVGSWSVGQLATITFPILDIREDGGNRIVKRARPYRDGEKLDDTGSMAKTFVIEAMFQNSIEEDGVQLAPLLYPDLLNLLLESFDTHETGILVLPTRGAVRCRAATYSRHEGNDERDSARVSLTFIADNEDNVGAAAFHNPSVTATLLRAEGETTFSCESMGAFSQALADLETACSDLQDAIAAPGEMVQDVDQKAARVVRILTEVEKQATVSNKLGRDLLTEPDAWAAVRQLRVMRDRTSQALQEKAATDRVVGRVFGVQLSIFDIATQLQQDPAGLINLNPHIEDVLAIPAGFTVRVFQD